MSGGLKSSLFMNLLQQGTGTVSGQGEQTFWIIFLVCLLTLVFSLPTLDLITLMGKDPPVIT